MKGWRSGESTRLPPMWPARVRIHVDAKYGLSLSLVLSLAPRSIFLRVQGGFPLSLKTSSFKVQFDLERTDKSQQILKNA